MHTCALSSIVLCRTVLSVLVGVLSLPTLAQSLVGSGPVGIAVEASGSLVVLDLPLGARRPISPRLR